MNSGIGPLYKTQLNQIEKDIQKLKELKWHQKWWGAFVLGFLSGLLSGIVVVIFF